MIKVYELVTQHAELGVSLGPFVVAAELFLKHKGLEFESIPLTFVEVGPTIKELTEGKWDRVPVVVFDNSDVIFDSPEIAKYLDEKYPDSRLDPDNTALDEIINDYSSNIAPNAILNAFDDLFALLEPENQVYFRLTREKFFGKKLEEVSGNRDINTMKFIQNIAKIDDLLSTSKFLNGNKPLIHDYTLASRIQYFRTVSPRTYKELILNGPNFNLLRWTRDMDNLFDDFLKNRKTVKYD
ncbi:hypothetical protein CONCODRAFT_18699 [Conidiobolus coronatus NRRL 28638]|uniref:GST N-terminal domain-containing protein n=1 Tax=Conidiobolus coronatus (strain ATCC 28846 / CBS 209.66 / NRRL 28638) TaxID=796925 RepID=A0A137P1J6_CONC2|nr:hypothetical protein CONCODRAFT_18699 [Conidiobolus coronatus NRRL 28638]|eukprot:KXN68913.1 hypothetical protein CONCODRAFT_18699 [Conidiobolus coronatus NRRL 28638]